jgi:cyclic dehypoxanthinyl futalosine synthase
MGSVRMEENVVSAAGTTYCLSEPLICRLIRDAGFVPAQRDNRYKVVKVHEGAGSPDVRVTDWSGCRSGKLQREGVSAGGALGKPVEVSLRVVGDS